jgi:membrane protease YdiL (CAAX protease family)
MQNSDPSSRKPQPALAHWGLWRTFLWTIGTLVALEAAGIVAIVIWQAAGHQLPKSDQDGAFFAFVGLMSAPIALGTVVHAAHKKAGPSIAHYLGLALPTFRQIAVAVGWLLLLVVSSDLISLVSGQPLVVDSQLDTWRSAQAAGWLPGLLLLTLVVYPVFEEVLFRGFLFEELEAGAIGPMATIVLTSILWTLLHIQNDWHALVQIFVTGLLLGSVRRWSGSTSLAIALHILLNMYATAETIAYAG